MNGNKLMERMSHKGIELEPLASFMNLEVLDLIKKINGTIPFMASEIGVLVQLLGLSSADEIDNIFFDDFRKAVLM